MSFFETFLIKLFLVSGPEGLATSVITDENEDYESLTLQDCTADLLLLLTYSKLSQMA